MERLCNVRWGSYSPEQVAQLLELSRDGYRVPVTLGGFMTSREAVEWCENSLKGFWVYSRRERLISESEAKRLCLKWTNPEVFDESSNYKEDMMVEALAEELQREIDYEIIQQLMEDKVALGRTPVPRPDHWFFFSTKDEAVKFQLRWGNDE